MNTETETKTPWKELHKLAGKQVFKASKATLNNFGRPVLIQDQEWQGEGKPKIERKRYGVFHIWGYKRSGGRNEAPHMQTVAIVELEDGRITSKLPDTITFLDVGTDETTVSK